MGETFGDWRGRGKRLTLASAKWSIEGLAIWRQALSRWKVDLPIAEGIIGYRVLPPRPHSAAHSFCFGQIPNEIYSLKVIALHTITPTVWYTCLITENSTLRRSLRLFLSIIRSSCIPKQNRDSSLKATLRNSTFPDVSTHTTPNVAVSVEP